MSVIENKVRDAWETLESARINLENLAKTFPLVRQAPLFKVVEMQMREGMTTLSESIGLPPPD